MNGLQWNERDDLDEWEFLLGCIQEDVSAELAGMGVTTSSSAVDGLDSSITTAASGPTIVQGVK